MVVSDPGVEESKGGEGVAPVVAMPQQRPLFHVVRDLVIDYHHNKHTTGTATTTQQRWVITANGGLACETLPALL